MVSTLSCSFPRWRPSARRSCRCAPWQCLKRRRLWLPPQAQSVMATALLRPALRLATRRFASTTTTSKRTAGCCRRPTLQTCSRNRAREASALRICAIFLDRAPCRATAVKPPRPLRPPPPRPPPSRPPPQVLGWTRCRASLRACSRARRAAARCRCKARQCAPRRRATSRRRRSSGGASVCSPVLRGTHAE